MPLQLLDVYVCRQLEDLEPLKGMLLTRLNLGSTKVQDLDPLRGMPLNFLNR